MIGRGGVTISRIRTQSAATIAVVKDKDGNGLVSLSGEPAAVAAARAKIPISRQNRVTLPSTHA